MQIKNFSHCCTFQVRDSVYRKVAHCMGCVCSCAQMPLSVKHAKIHGICMHFLDANVVTGGLGLRFGMELLYRSLVN